MRFPRSLVFSLMMSMCVAPSLAQAPQELAPAPTQNPFAAHPLPGNLIPPMDFHLQIPQGATAGRRVFRLPSRRLRSINPFVAHANDLYAAVTPLPLAGLPPGRNPARNDSRCFAIRDYQFSRAAPNSDATKLSGSSTCEPAAQVRLKGAVVR